MSTTTVNFPRFFLWPKESSWSRKNCDESICKPIATIFRSVMFRKWEVLLRMEKRQCSSCLQKKKKKHKHEVKKYRSISLLPVSNKIFERLLYDIMFKVFTENSLISQNQSGFKPGDSCTNQLLSITHQIYKSFDDGHEVRSVFLHIKSFW